MNYIQCSIPHRLILYAWPLNHLYNYIIVIYLLPDANSANLADENPYFSNFEHTLSDTIWLKYYLLIWDSYPI